MMTSVRTPLHRCFSCTWADSRPRSGSKKSRRCWSIHPMRIFVSSGLVHMKTFCGTILQTRPRYFWGNCMGQNSVRPTHLRTSLCFPVTARPWALSSWRPWLVRYQWWQRTQEVYQISSWTTPILMQPTSTPAFWSIGMKIIRDLCGSWERTRSSENGSHLRVDDPQNDGHGMLRWRNCAMITTRQHKGILTKHGTSAGVEV
mmetsp:Transcript_75404/g.208771  ORF Transcript_75404/g.208771 Transcript_75404/m.208771 type:complete len:202 (+) Transcript_75404:669-1274(+)